MFVGRRERIMRRAGLLLSLVLGCVSIDLRAAADEAVAAPARSWWPGRSTRAAADLGHLS
jgi:hypothetical protein